MQEILDARRCINLAYVDNSLAQKYLDPLLETMKKRSDGMRLDRAPALYEKGPFPSHGVVGFKNLDDLNHAINTFSHKILISKTFPKETVAEFREETQGASLVTGILMHLNAHRVSESSRRMHSALDLIAVEANAAANMKANGVSTSLDFQVSISKVNAPKVIKKNEDSSKTHLQGLAWCELISLVSLVSMLLSILETDKEKKTFSQMEMMGLKVNID
jgi:hypothetical protein